MAEHTDIVEAIVGLLGDGVWKGFMSVFERAEVCDAEIKRAQEEWPEKADELDDVFAVALTPVIPHYAPLSIWRVHFRQLCRTVATGGDLDEPTLIEWACIGAELSQNAPLRHDFMAPYMRDRETMEAFCMEPVDYPKGLGDEHRRDVREAIIKAFVAEYGMARSSRYRQERDKRALRRKQLGV